MKWIYLSVYYDIYKFLGRIRKHSDWRLVAFSSISIFSICLTIILDQILRLIEKSIEFNYSEYHMMTILGGLIVLNAILVYDRPGIRRIEEVSVSLSPIKKRTSRILVAGIVGTTIVIIIRLFLK